MSNYYGSSLDRAAIVAIGAAGFVLVSAGAAVGFLFAATIGMTASNYNRGAIAHAEGRVQVVTLPDQRKIVVEVKP